MAFRLVVQCWNIVNWSIRNKLQWNFNRNSYIFIQKNAIEDVVCETAAICLRPQFEGDFRLTERHSVCVPYLLPHYIYRHSMDSCWTHLPPPPPPPPPPTHTHTHTHSPPPPHLLEWKCKLPIWISLKLIPGVQLNNKPALVQVMAWPSSLTHICGTRGDGLALTGPWDMW